MNPLTLVKRIQGLNSKEAELGISEDASWHAKYKDSAYVFAGGIPFDLTEGDLLAVFSQYGEIVDVNLVRDKATGKSKGFAFIAYEDQRSTILAIDNLNGAQVLGRTIRVDHVTKYKKKEEEDEETEQRKRQERGVCRAFQMGECSRGAGCKFSHDEQRAANTGWGQHEDKNSRWGHDKFDGPKKNERNGRALDGQPDQSDRREDKKSRRLGDSKFESKSRDQERGEGRRLTGTGYRDDEFERKAEDHHRREDKRRRSHNDDDNEPRPLKDGYRREEERSRTRRHVDDEFEPRSREDRDRGEEKRSRRYVGDEFEPRLREDHKIREERRSRRQEDGEPKSRDDYDRRLRTHDPESYQREDQDERGDSRLTHSKGSSSRHQR